MRLNELSHAIIGAAMKVHTDLGPGLLERTYQVFLAHELTRRGFSVESEVALPITHEGVTVELGYRVDLIVQKTVIVEVKAVSQIVPVHRSQLLTQLKFSGLPLGLLINFHERHLRHGISRLINTPHETSVPPPLP